ncbi:MAG: hypothetical protein A3C55_02390 [Gammaproteobacteria bacterium RIFCSPHIGHO2_02_FULL_42_13]|nr:MAG: hypothetical protein A3C55_02390 [Gammaproteobacteria bacterium RIFCSPHIGHO2_02_FULL_42_13]OGT68488.1 MAG: hypothetical protein A3H43_03695 [Gammaproteobacteria bacterium RIFCSPLOWO2_02_FULL_42_9]
MELISAKAYFKASIEDKLQFPVSTCSVTISVGQRSQEGAKLAATINIINKKFKSCAIMVCDSLQRHTLEIDQTYDRTTLHEKANKIGEQWLKSNQKYFSIFSIPFEIIRWDTWLTHPQYNTKRSTINNLFNTNIDYQNQLLLASNIFIERYQAINHITLNPVDALHCSLEYLKEECAVMLLWADKKYNFEIYPSKRNAAFAATYKYLIAPTDLNILKPISLELKSRHSKCLQKLFLPLDK